MIAIEVFVNGDRIALAGVPQDDQLIGAVFSGRRLAVELRPDEPRTFERYTELRLSGLTEQEHWYWAEARALQAGDDIRFCIREVETADPPVLRVPRISAAE